MARPPMNMGDELARPHMSEPTSNTNKKNRYIHYTIVSLPGMSVAVGDALLL